MSKLSQEKHAGSSLQFVDRSVIYSLTELIKVLLLIE